MAGCDLACAARTAPGADENTISQRRSTLQCFGTYWHTRSACNRQQGHRSWFLSLYAAPQYIHASRHFGGAFRQSTYGGRDSGSLDVSASYLREQSIREFSPQTARVSRGRAVLPRVLLGFA